MKLKMSEHSLFAILLRSPWWMSAAIAAGIVAMALAWLPGEYKVVGALTSLPFLVIGGMAAWKQFRSPSATRIAATLDAVRAMSWADFSRTVEDAYRRDGYEVIRIGRAAADFELIKGGRTALVSCKRWKVARTGVEPLRDLEAAKDAREAHECIYIAAGEVTEHARKFAAAKKIRLLGGPELVRMLPRARRSAAKTAVH